MQLLRVQHFQLLADIVLRSVARARDQEHQLPRVKS